MHRMTQPGVSAESSTVLVDQTFMVSLHITPATGRDNLGHFHELHCTSVGMDPMFGTPNSTVTLVRGRICDYCVPDRLNRISDKYSCLVSIDTDFGDYGLLRFASSADSKLVCSKTTDKLHLHEQLNPTIVVVHSLNLVACTKEQTAGDDVLSMQILACCTIPKRCQLFRRTRYSNELWMAMASDQGLLFTGHH